MRLALVVLIIVVVVIVGYFGWEFQQEKSFKLPLSTAQTKEKPLDKYTFDALAKTKFEPSEIELGDVIEDNASFRSRLFFFEDSGKKVSGQINIPAGQGSFPVIVMFRGYVDREVYTTGVGTQRAGEVFARNGFVTLAPDFLGYGQSDSSSSDVMEERFQTYTAAIILLRSVENLNKTFDKEGIEGRADIDKLGIWGHSNGGQIAISTLEITGENIPTVLWAPVSKPFPYSVLYYTDEFDDRGKFLRREIAKFEKDYDVDNYSIEKFFGRINAPIQIYQGTLDESVPQSWSDEFVASMKELNKDMDYVVFPGADHNLLPNGWNSAVAGGMEFYRKHFE
ncbi:MAG: hypothetical protein A3B44_00760 [Candidatus Levybacteria bacterium RIFCSPLOWO2_01_FULL_38_21]|uniref:Peptidase S9 prolyl oligopeptidase active site domain-containing protein n=1 Tax=Candidatus Curtissbacteria bacterium GW2011_GWA1_41_11 TaxID=1618409 RepID=A0A0G0UDN3_9BACT|nr:MAG: Peptidase S9 prolyl oligopeptidase active site domain-containing protein [Candidatus Curtissbacteria bacterium GW2011_GWA1_41_11]OGH38033.1 MAG: hypothetical protein A3B44_00760 [Candidatus Levybacteria bacterium RIFCSPLOWO2_01_FULL_38_21]